MDLAGNIRAHLPKLWAVACVLTGGPQHGVQQGPHQPQQDGYWNQAHMEPAVLTCPIHPACHKQILSYDLNMLGVDSLMSRQPAAVCH